MCAGALSWTTGETRLRHFSRPSPSVSVVLSKKSPVNNSLHLWSEEISLIEEWISLDSNSSRVKIHYSTSGISSGSLDIDSKKVISDSVTNRVKNLFRVIFQCKFIWKETMRLVSGKVEFNACQVSLLWHNSFLVNQWTSAHLRIMCMSEGQNKILEFIRIVHSREFLFYCFYPLLHESEQW